VQTSQLFCIVASEDSESLPIDFYVIRIVGLRERGKWKCSCCLSHLNSLAHALSLCDLMIIGNGKRVEREDEDFPSKFLGGGNPCS